MENTIASPAFTPQSASAEGFSPDSRVWLYVANRPLSEAESAEIEEELQWFTRNWTAHNAALKARSEVFRRQAILLMVDETAAGASGCSIDKSVHFLEAAGSRMGIDFFDRMRFAWAEGEQLHFAHRDDFSALVQSGRIGPDTPVLNTLVKTKAELGQKWLLPFGQSWLRRIV